MTPSNGSISHVTDPLCGEFTGHRRIPLTKASDAELWCFFICAWTNGWVNKLDADDLRCYRAHYDVTLISLKLQMMNGVHYSLKILKIRIRFWMQGDNSGYNPSKIACIRFNYHIMSVAPVHIIICLMKNESAWWYIHHLKRMNKHGLPHKYRFQQKYTRSCAAHAVIIKFETRYFGNQMS